MICKRLQAIDQWQVTESEEVRSGSEIVVNQLFHAQVIMTMSLFQVAQKVRKTPRLKGFQLFLQRFHIRGQCELAPIVEDQMIGWVDALKFQHVPQRGSQCGELRFI